MSKLQLINNNEANWDAKEFYYDENGQAHRHYLRNSDNYTLESGDAYDDARAIQSGIIFENEFYNEEEWN